MWCQMRCINRKALRAVVFFAGFYLYVASESCNAQDKANNLKTLLKERRDLLSDIATQMTEAYLLLGAKISLHEVILAERDSLNADLDCFEKPEERIQAIEKHKKVADSLNKAATANFAAARQPKYVVLQARAYVLEVQIELLKERKKKKANPGR